MAIDANVAYVELKEDGSGTLHLCDRVPNGSRGQSRLSFESAPYEVTALNGLSIWGGDNQIMLGDVAIAARIGYTRISFIERDRLLEAVQRYHAARRNERLFGRDAAGEPGVRDGRHLLRHED